MASGCVVDCDVVLGDDVKGLVVGDSMPCDLLVEVVDRSLLLSLTRISDAKAVRFQVLIHEDEWDWLCSMADRLLDG